MSAGFDPDAQLDQSDLARLLVRAITTLPAQTSKILLEHYLEGTPHSELAQKLGVSAGLVAVRLQRARRSLQRLLQTDPQAQALAYGIAAGSSSGWEETNIWCPACGQCRFWGQFHTEFPGARFMLRCPRCHPAPGSIGVMVDLAIPYYRQLFGGVRAYKPAYTRLFTGIASYYQQALHAHQAVCMACGHPAGVHRIPKETREHPGLRRDIEVRIVCPACGWASNSTLSGLAMALPETQQFWRQNPRMQTLPVEEIETQGTLAYLTRLQSITTTAELAVISRKDTLEPLGIQGPIKL